MIKTSFDSKQLSKTLNNVVSYSEGFTRGVHTEQPNFNRDFGLFLQEALSKFIDAKARANPQSLHHVYEWGMVGSPAGRLFDFSMTYTKSFISFTGRFLPSVKPSETSTEPFTEKAKIMENKITITINPESTDFLVFEDEGQTIFTSESVVIENPGGDFVAGSFEKVVKEFFSNYLTVGILKNSGIFDKLKYAKEYSSRFVQGSKVGTSAGISAGRQYLSLGGIRLEWA